MDILMDILLLPKKLYKNVNSNKFSLYLGFILVGAVDVGFALYDRFSKLFIGRSQNDLYFNIFIACVYAVVIGVIDVLCFSKPLFDLFKRFKEEPGAKSGGTLLIKLMKVYITANIMLIPVQAAYLYLIKILGSPDTILAYLLLILGLAIQIWFSAVIARGINSLYNFQHIYKRLVFPMVLLWTYLLSLALSMVDTWIGFLFR